MKASVCGASIAKGDGSHRRCLLPTDHPGDCDPRIRNPRALRTSELLRHASAMLRDLGASVAEELAARALRFDRLRAKVEIAKRRGYELPRELLDLVDVDETEQPS